MQFAIAPAVERTREFYRMEADERNLPISTIVAEYYRTILRLPEVLQVEQQTLAGNPPTFLYAPEWSVQVASLMGALCTVMLACEFNLVRRAA